MKTDDDVQEAIDYRIMDRRILERCDECGEFVSECSLVVSGIDESKSICKKCDAKHYEYCVCGEKRKLIMRDKALVCSVCGKPPCAVPLDIFELWVSKQ